MIRKTERFALFSFGTVFVCVSGYLLTHVPDLEGIARLEGITIILFIAVFGVGLISIALSRY